MDDIYFSAQKKAELESELERLVSVERAEVAAEIEQAKSLGDLSENAEYHAARERQGKLEDRIKEIEYKLKYGKVVAAGSSDVVSIGHQVEVVNDAGKTIKYEIVGQEEQDIMTGRISHTSPIGSGLLGKKVGDQAIITVPSGTMVLTVKSIS